MRTHLLPAAILTIALHVPGVSAQLPAPAPAPDVRAAVARLYERVVDHGALTIALLQVGAVSLDTNRVQARVTNRGDTACIIALNLRAVPGLWVRGNWQREFSFAIPAKSEQTIEAFYVFRRMTPEATLRVAIGVPRGTGSSSAIAESLFDTTVVVGQGNHAAFDPRPAFVDYHSDHFDLLAWKGSAASRQLPALAAQREAAVRRIADLMAVPARGRILLVLYPDSSTKTTQTGSIGAGFADGHTIIEIRNDSVQLDPYHEVAHIVSGERGNPPAMFDEGFAVYVSQMLGADALKYLDAPGRTAGDRTCEFQRTGQLIALARLFNFTEIGSDSTQAGIAYPESASFTEFLIERYGIDRFRDAFARLKNSTDVAQQRQNAESMRVLYSADLASLERNWRDWLHCDARRAPVTSEARR